MAKKKNSNIRPNKLREFMKWEGKAQVDSMLDAGIAPTQVVKWCKENGFDISAPTMYVYAKRRKENIVKMMQFDKAVPPQRKSIKLDPETHKTIVDETVRTGKIRSDLEMLDAIIQKGMDSLKEVKVISPYVAMKAIELKYRLTGGAHNGLTVYGMEEIRVRESARENAILKVMMKYIPEGAQDSVLNEMEAATKEYYEGIGMGEAYEMAENQAEGE